MSYDLGVYVSISLLFLSLSHFYFLEGVWSESFHKEYFMVLPYINGSFLYIIGVHGECLVSWFFKGLYWELYGCLSLICFNF
jgi:hypothetical protein